MNGEQSRKVSAAFQAHSSRFKASARSRQEASVAEHRGEQERGGGGRLAGGGTGPILSLLGASGGFEQQRDLV